MSLFSATAIIELSLKEISAHDDALANEIPKNLYKYPAALLVILIRCIKSIAIEDADDNMIEDTKQKDQAQPQENRTIEEKQTENDHELILFSKIIN